MRKILLLFVVIPLFNSCLLAINGAPHVHSCKEINDKDDLELKVVCFYLNKTFEIRNADPKDSFYIQSSSFNRPKERKSFYQSNSSDSTKLYNWRIGDWRYHRNLKKDTIEITKISTEGKEYKYTFVAIPKVED